MKSKSIIITLFLIISFFTFFKCTEDNSDLFVVREVAEGLDFPEGPAWDGKGTLFISNCYGGWIAEFNGTDLDTFTSKNQSHDLLNKTNGLALGKDGNLYACDYGIGAILRITPAGKVSTFIPGFNGQPFNRPNDIAFDSKGDLFFTDPKSYDPENRDGVVYRYTHEAGALRPIIKGLAFPNGIAISADEKHLFVCESAMNRILKYTITGDTNFIEPEVFVVLPGGDPDGIAFDVKGNLYVAHFGTGTIFKIDPQGEIIRKIEMPGKKPTNLEFAGQDMRTLYITEVETNALYQVKVDDPGLKLFYMPGE